MISLPNPDVIVSMKHWNNLPDEDRSKYLQMRQQFLNQVKSHSKDRRCLTFSSEVQAILEFVDHSPKNREDRSVVSGLAFAGPFICVNTRQLKSFIGRCKSSINGSFQQVGYLAIKTKAKARECVCSFLPSLHNDPGTLRQWTVRYSANCIFKSIYTPSEMPEICDDDLYEDKRKHPPQNEFVPPVLNPMADSPSHPLSPASPNSPVLSQPTSPTVSSPVIETSPLSPDSPLSPVYGAQPQIPIPHPQIPMPPQIPNNPKISITNKRHNNRMNNKTNNRNHKLNSHQFRNVNCDVKNDLVQVQSDNDDNMSYHQRFNFDLSCFKNPEKMVKIPEIKPSFSVDFLAFDEDDDDWGDVFFDSPLADVSSKTLTRSNSTSPFNDWGWQFF